MTSVEIEKAVALFEGYFGESYGKKAYTARAVLGTKVIEASYTYVVDEHPDLRRRACCEARKRVVSGFLDHVTPSRLKALQTIVARLERGEEIGI